MGDRGSPLQVIAPCRRRKSRASYHANSPDRTLANTGNRAGYALPVRFTLLSQWQRNAFLANKGAKDVSPGDDPAIPKASTVI